MAKEAQALRDQAAKHYQDAEDSFQRSDTDGFLSQWASGITAQKLMLQAQIVENGGMADFEALLSAATGEEIPSRVISTQYGICFAVCDDQGKFTGEFVSVSFTQRSKHWAKYRIGIVQAPARAIIAAPKGAKGLSGAASCYVIAERIYPSQEGAR